MSKATLYSILGKGLIVLGLILLVVFSFSGNIVAGLFIASMPIILLLLIKLTASPYIIMLCLFTYNYFVMEINRYTGIEQLGLGTDFMLVLVLFSLLLRTVFLKDVDWSNAKNGGGVLLSIWLGYCIFEIANPSAITEAWVYTIRAFIYPVITVLFTSLIFFHYKDFKLILFLWSIFTIIAVIKMQMQVSFGFDPIEMHWLMQGDRSKLIFLQGGIRYFSIFTDPGNFGSNMGCAMVVFSISAIYVQKNWLKIYYGIVGLLGMYSMFISGTRGALAVPFAGFFLYSILTKNFKALLISGFFIFGAYFFLAQTSIGQGNQQIRRMRTAFDPNEASLMVRKQNQKTLAIYLKNKPFGEGLGLAGVESKRFANRVTTTIPSDSGFVKIWCMTGIVGLILYLSIYLGIVAYGTYIILFKIKDSELRGFLSAVLAGLFGIIASTYGNSILTQYPTSILMSMTIAFLFMGKKYDEEILLLKINTQHEC
jgi:hypothetical protein